VCDFVAERKQKWYDSIRVVKSANSSLKSKLKIGDDRHDSSGVGFPLSM